MRAMEDVSYSGGTEEQASSSNGNPQQHQEEETLLQTASQACPNGDFSVHRLLLSPRQSPYVTPHVGYGNHYEQSLQYLPPYHYGGSGLEGGQRWPIFPPYPMPPPPSYVTPSSPLAYPAEAPTTPNHIQQQEASASTSPVDLVPSPHDSNMHMYNPANAGLYTLCQAALQQENEQGGYPPQTTEQQQLTPPMSLSHSLRPPPPPYINYYHQQPPSTPFSVDGHHSLHSQTSPQSPHPPISMYPTPHTPGAANEQFPQSSFWNAHNQSPYALDHPIVVPHEPGTTLDNTERPGPSFTNHHLPNPLPIVQDGMQPGPSYMQLEPPSQGQPDDSHNSAEKDVVIDLANRTVASGGRDDEDSTDGTSNSVMMFPLIPLPLPQAAGVVVPPPGNPSSSRCEQKNKSKRTRTAYTQHQQDQLELAFHVNPYPDGYYRQKVALDVGIPEDRVQVWFQNRRARGKKQTRTGSVSCRSKIREIRLRLNIANMASQGIIIKPIAHHPGQITGIVHDAAAIQSLHIQQQHSTQGQYNNMAPASNMQQSAFQQPSNSTAGSSRSNPNINTFEYRPVEEREDTPTARAVNNNAAMYTFPQPSQPSPTQDQDSSEHSDQSSSNSSPNSNTSS